MADIACQRNQCGAPSEYRSLTEMDDQSVSTIYLCGECHLELVNLGRIIESWSGKPLKTRAQHG